MDRSRQRRRRLDSALLALFLGLALLAACRSTPPLAGTVLDEAKPAPEFRLIDQLGQPVALGDLRGKPVALMFLYTHCPDVCPLTADKVRAALDRLGGDAARVAAVAISTDPERDDVASARQFSADHGLLDRWHFLIGSRTTLQPIWSAYGIYTAPSSTPGFVDHSAPLYLLDKAGRGRAVLSPEFTADDLAGDLRILLAE